MPGQYPLTEIGHLPFMFRNSYITGLSMLEAFEGGYFGDEWQDVLLVSFRPNNTYNIMTRNKEVQTLEDWQGQKVAARGITDTEMIKLLGGTPVSLSSAERYDALAKGMIDQANLEWEGHYIWRHYEVTKYRTSGCDMMIGAGTNHAMSYDSYNELPADLQAVFDKYIGEFLTSLTSLNMDRENEWRRVMIQEHDSNVGNPPFYELPAAERARWVDKMTEMYDNYLDPLEARGLPARACFDKLKELSAKYEAMYPPLSEVHLQKMLDYGYEVLHPGWPQPVEAFDWLYEATGKDNVSSPPVPAGS
jgi:TRAP-type C4-dicarboxylate transport system substrate-binding protein